MIAEGRLVAVSKSDCEEISIGISKPIENDGEWHCKIVIIGTKLAGIYNIKGEYSMSSLCLALEFVRILLVGEEERGVMYTFPQDAETHADTFSYPLKGGEYIPINSYFGKVTLESNL